MIDGPVTGFQSDLSDMVLAGREAVGHFAAHHAPDDPLLGEGLAVLVDGLDGLAVTDHGDFITAV